MRRFVAAIVLAFIALTPAASRAGIVYSYVSENATYNLSSAGPVTVKIFLLENLSGGAQSLIVQDGGLYAFGVKVDRESGQLGGLGIQSVGVADIQSVNSNAAGLWPSNVPVATSVSASSASFGAISNSDFGTATNVNPDGNGKILLGSITINAQSGSTHFTFTKYPPPDSGGQTVTAGASPASQNVGLAYDLDFDNNAAFGGDPFAAYIGTTSSATGFDVIVGASVPEPSSLLLCGLAATGGAWFQRRRKVNAGKQLE